MSVERRHAVIDIHHVGGLDEGVVEILVRRVERMVDLERAAALAEIAVDLHITFEDDRAFLSKVGDPKVSRSLGIWQGRLLLIRSPVSAGAVVPEA